MAPDFNLLVRIVFNYGMNYKGNTGMDGTIPFKASMAWHPSAFVFLSESRTHGAEASLLRHQPDQ